MYSVKNVYVYGEELVITVSIPVEEYCAQMAVDINSILPQVQPSNITKE